MIQCVPTTLNTLDPDMGQEKGNNTVLYWFKKNAKAII